MAPVHPATAEGTRGLRCRPAQRQHGVSRSFFSSSEHVLRPVPCREQSALDVGHAAMHETAHRLTAQTPRQTVQLFHHCREHGRRIEQVHGDKVIRDQHLAELQIVFHAVAEQPAGEGPAFAPRRNDPALPGAARRGELPGEAHPCGQVEGGNASRTSGKTDSDLVPRQLSQ